MDVANATENGHNKLKDDVGDRCQKLFLDFLEGYLVYLFFFSDRINLYNKITGLKLMANPSILKWLKN